MKKMTEKEAWLWLAEKMETKPNFICHALEERRTVGHIGDSQYEFMREDLLRFRPYKSHTCSDAWWGCTIFRTAIEHRVYACLFLAAMCK